LRSLFLAGKHINLLSRPYQFDNNQRRFSFSEKRR
jgi:hypothetical protein